VRICFIECANQYHEMHLEWISFMCHVEINAQLDHYFFEQGHYQLK